MERFTVQELAEYLGVSGDTVYKMVRKREIPHFRIRKIILFTKESVDEWINDQVEDSTK